MSFSIKEKIRQIFSKIMGFMKIFGRNSQTDAIKSETKSTNFNYHQIRDPKKKALLATLRSMNSYLGLINKIEIFGDHKLIIIIHDTPFINVSVSEVIYRILSRLIELRLIPIVAIDGAHSGDVSTGWLKGITDYSLRGEVVDTLFEQGKLTAVEYLHVKSNTPFILFGPEDEQLYDQAAKLWVELAPLWKFINEDRSGAQIQKALNDPSLRSLCYKFAEFDTLDHKRADKILENMLNKMGEVNQDIAALVCKGNLPQYISTKAEDEFISYVIINPSNTSVDDINEYEKRLNEQVQSR